MTNLKLRLIVLNFLQFAVWGSYLTSMGAYLGSIGLGTDIGNYYAMQGIVSLFMPALIGVVADRWMPAQRALSFCHLASAVFMFLTAWTGLSVEAGQQVNSTLLFAFYSFSIAFYMPSLSLSYSVAYNALDKAGIDSIKTFPVIRVFGTLGFMVMMWIVDFSGIQNSAWQFAISGFVGVLMSLYSLTMPNCPVNKSSHVTVNNFWKSENLSILRNKVLRTFFIFSFLLGVALQITNGYANTYIQSFGQLPEYASSFFVRHSNLLVSVSQFSETLCLLLIPFFLQRYGIKRVMLISMMAWVFRFGLLGVGNPGEGVWMFFISCIVYGIAFDFFNISGSLFMDRVSDPARRSYIQGLFMFANNGLGATLGSFGARFVINHFVYVDASNPFYSNIEGWRISWLIFAAYMLLVAIAFKFMFHDKTKEV